MPFFFTQFTVDIPAPDPHSWNTQPDELSTQHVQPFCDIKQEYNQCLYGLETTPAICDASLHNIVYADSGLYIDYIGIENKTLGSDSMN